MNGIDKEVRFEIVEHIGVLTTHATGWNKELNIVSWNGGQQKYDIRDWNPEHTVMSRGITLSEKEMRQIFDLMKRRRMNHREGQSQGDEEKPVAPPKKKEKEPER